METTQRQHIAETIRAARLQRGWTVTEAATRLGTGESNWSRWETATAVPRPATLVAIGELLELPDDWMVPATMRHPSRSVDADEMLERITAELAEQRQMIEQMYERLTRADSDDGRKNPLGERDDERSER